MSQADYLALAAGKMPDRIKPGTSEHRAYLEVLAAIESGKASMEAVALSDGQLARVIELLRS